MRADVQRFSLSDPGDVSGLRAAIEAGAIDPATIVAVIGKTPGNGLVNDYTRGYLTLSLALLIGEKTGETPDAVRARVPFVFSGGTEGVLSPHYAVFTVVPSDEAPNGEKALAVGVAFTAPFEPADIGRQSQIDMTADAVSEAMAKAGIDDPADVHFVQIKGPAFSLAEIAAGAAAGKPAVADNPGKLMLSGLGASAFGAARALGEVAPDRAVEANLFKDMSIFSSVASASAGGEVKCNEVIVIGMSDKWTGPLAIAHSTFADALDVDGMHAVVRALGFSPGMQIPAAEAGRIRAGFVKCEASLDGLIRGRPHTMLDDGDIDQQRHIRAAVGAIAAGILNDTALFVSGGAKHQGPDGGGIIAVISERA